MFLTREEVLAQMPKVGDKRMEVPTEAKGIKNTNAAPQKCTVVDVHPDHLWYTVEFESGFRESYKVPFLVEPDRGGGLS